MKKFQTVKWSFPTRREQKTNQIINGVDTYTQFEKITNTIIHRFDNKVAPYIREGQRYYNLKKYQSRIREKFPKVEKGEERGKDKAIEIKSCIQVDRESCESIGRGRKIDIFIEFIYKKQYQNEEMEQNVRETNTKIKNIREKLANKMIGSADSYLNNLRILHKNTSLENEFTKTIKIYFLISEPLVKRVNLTKQNQIIKQSLKQKINLEKHSQAITKIHEAKNCSINLMLDKRYLSWNKLNQLVNETKQEILPKKGDQRVDLFVLQIYTELYKENNEIYVSIQDDAQIGMENRRIKLAELMRKLNEIPNLYLVMLMGQKMRMLKENPRKSSRVIKQPQKKTGIKIMENEMVQSQQGEQATAEYKQWYREINVPIITINSFDIEKDYLYVQKILQQIYKRLFERQNIKQAFKEIKNQMYEYILKRVHQELSIPQCCCLHTDFDQVYMASSNRQPVWAKVVQVVGISTAHRLFMHFKSKDFKRVIQDRKLMTEMVGFILGERPKDNTFCKDDHKDIRVSIGDFLLFNEDIKHTWPGPEEKAEYGMLKKNNIERNKTQLYRPMVLYRIIYRITHESYNSKKILAIVGGSRTGKSLFLDLAERYIKNRDYLQKYKFIRIKNWLQQYKNGNLIEQILKQSSSINQKSKLIVNFGKIHNELKQYFEKFVKEYTQNQEITQSNILIICALSESHQIQHFYKGIEQYYIQNMSESEMLSIILKDEAIMIRKQEEVRILKNIIEIFKSGKDKEEKPREVGTDGSISSVEELDFDYFRTNLPNMIKHILEKKAEEDNKIKEVDRYDELKAIEMKRQLPDVIHQIIVKELQKYRNKTITTLGNIWNYDQDLWKAVGFVCSFKEGFFLCDFNEMMALKDKNYAEEFVKYKNGKIFRIDLLENDSKSHKFLKTMSILSENNCYKQFKPYMGMFFPRKVNYFLHFYYKVFELLKKHPKDSIYFNCKRAIKKLGIFMYDYEPALKSYIQQDTKQHNYIEIDKITQMTIQQRQYIYNYVLEMHIKAFIEFTKEATENNYTFGEEDKVLQIKILYAILLVAIIHQHEDTLESSKRDQLYIEIIRYLEKKKSINQSKEYKILRAQITSIIIDRRLGDEYEGEDLAVENFCKLKVIENLKYYEQIRKTILRERKIVKKQFYTLSKWLESIDSATQSKESSKQVEDEKQRLAEKLKKIILKIENIRELITKNIQRGKLQSIEERKHLQCSLDLVIMKVAIKFEYFHADSTVLKKTDDLKSKELKSEIEGISAKIGYKELYDQNVVNICSAYLKLNTHQCTHEDIPKIQNEDVLPLEFKEMFHYVQRKLNPKLLFRSGKLSNIALFMKANFLKYQNIGYNYIRMGNIISSFMHKEFKDHDLNLLFLNLSEHNFKMVSNEEAEVTYFILSVDYVEEKGKLNLIFENRHGTGGVHIDIDQFMKWISVIKFKFLILFGSKSHELSKEIQRRKKSIQKSCIISLTFIDKELNLSTYPLDKNPMPTPYDIVQDFIKNQNAQRIMEMTICCLIAFLIKEKENQFQQMKRNVIQKYVSDSKRISIKVIQKWYSNNKEQSKMKYEIGQEIYLNQVQKLYFPFISKGSIMNLTQQIIAVPKNFVDDQYYENVGRIREIQQIINKLTSYKNCLIKIVGGPKSGKSQLLKQIGWLCQTRKIFELGIYLYDVKSLFQKKQEDILFHHTKKSYFNKKSLLILLDNLESEIFEENIKFFSNFFEQINKMSASIVYTTSENLQNRNCHIQKEFIQKRGKNQSRKKHKELTININKLESIEKICLALINIRNRGNKSYFEIFDENFPLLKNLEIKKIDKTDLTLRWKKSAKTNKRTSYNKKKKLNASNNQNNSSKESKNLVLTCALSRKMTGPATVPSPLPFDAEPPQNYYPTKSAFAAENGGINTEVSKNKFEINFEGSHQINSDSGSAPSQQTQDLKQFSYKSKTLESSSLNGSIYKMQQQQQLFNTQPDLAQVIQMCNSYKESAMSQGEATFQQSYLNFDVTQIIEQIQIMSKSKIEIINEFYFKREKFY